MRRQDNRPAGTRVDRQAGLGLQVVSCGIRKQQQQQQIRRKVGEPVVGVAQQDDGLACGRMKHTHTHARTKWMDAEEECSSHSSERCRKRDEDTTGGE